MQIWNISVVAENFIGQYWASRSWNVRSALTLARSLYLSLFIHLLNGNSNSREPYGVFVRNNTLILIKHLELPIAPECSMRIGPYCLRGDCPYLCAFTWTFRLWKVVLESRKIRTHTMAAPKVTELCCFIF